MVAQQHYQRLKHLYAANAAENATGPVDISYGYAELTEVVDGRSSSAVLNRMPFQQPLSDVASLAAGSVEKEERLAMEYFNLSVEQPEYRGTVRATAEVIFAEPPQYHVRAVLRDADDDEFVAEALAIFAPSGEELPPDPSPEAGDEEAGPSPAPFMPGHVTPYGILCLN